MRTLLAILAVLNLGVWGYGHSSGATTPLEQGTAATVARLRFHKEIRFEGTALLDEGDLRALLPIERSNVWWELQRSEIGTKLLDHPLLKSAKVERCGVSRWGCFTVRVTERQPDFITEFSGKVWLVGGDGAFLGRAPRAALDEVGEPHARLNPVILKGLDFDKTSPDNLKARLDLIRSSIEVIEKGVGLKVRSATLVGGSDVSIRLDDRPYTITFGLPDGGTERLEEEVARYNRLAAELGEKHRLVRSIDLAFEKVAVVKFIE